MEKSLENTGLHMSEINRNVYVYEEAEMDGARSTLGLNEKWRENFSRNA